MIYFFPIVLLIIGCLQSYYGLQKDNSSKVKKNRINQLLSYLYFGSLCIGVFVIILQNKEADKNNNLLTFLSTKSTDQLSTLKKVVTKTDSLIETSDSINQHLISQNKLNKSLISQYDKVNAQLSKQIDLELKKFKDSSPSINFMEDELFWEGADSTLRFLRIYIRNHGKRNANVLGTKGVLVFFNRSNQPIFEADIPETKRNITLSPNETNPMEYDFASYGIRDFHNLKAKTDYAVICLEIHYKDIGMGNDTTIYQFSGWIPKYGFGGLKDWQTNLGKRWAINNGKFQNK